MARRARFWTPPFRATVGGVSSEGRRRSTRVTSGVVAIAVLAASPLSACTDRRAPAPDASAEPTWPAFPTSPEARDALLADRTRRRPTAAAEVTPEHVFARAERAGWSTLPSGDAQLRAWIEQRLARPDDPHGTSWLLFGTFHDAAGQVDAFRGLVGPGGVPFTHIVLEQLRADGRWTGVDASQAGDSALLARYLETGDRAAYESLARAHEAHDYTAWKYGYARGVLDVVTTARALGIPALPCDLPDALMTRAGTDEEAYRLRELHCLLAVRGAVTRPGARIAMLWGQAHVRADGFRRFLPAGDRVLSLYAIGTRHSPDAPDERLRDRLVLHDPVLVPLGEDEAALLLPDPQLGGRLDRVRTHGEATAPAIRVTTTTPGTLRVGARSVEVRSEEEAQLRVEPGAHTFCFESGPFRMVGSVEVPTPGEVELSFDPPSRSTRRVESGPALR